MIIPTENTLNQFETYFQVEKQTAGGPPGLRLSEDDGKVAAANPVAKRAKIFGATAWEAPRRHKLRRYV